VRIVISPSHIIGDLVATSKRGALAEITALLPGFDQDELQSALLEREAVGSTAIETGLAVPHAKLAAAQEIQVCFARSQAGIQWGAPDHQLVHLIFLVVAPLQATTTYLETLATLCRFLRDSNNSSRLLRSTDDQLAPLLAAAKGLQ
jgi:mannitol/fructose-specific phosphotransferase system IIA component (Ntr-type)